MHLACTRCLRLDCMSEVYQPVLMTGVSLKATFHTFEACTEDSFEERSCRLQATFDTPTSSFIIHTPTNSASKFWIGGSAQSATASFDPLQRSELQTSLAEHAHRVMNTLHTASCLQGLAVLGYAMDCTLLLVSTYPCYAI